MNEKKRLAINMVAQIGSFAIGLAINFLLTPYVTKHVGKEIYGYVGLANTFTSYINVFTTAFNAMLNRYVTINVIQKDYKSANQYYTTVAVANIVGSIILIIPSAVTIIFLDSIIKIPTSFILDVKILWLFIFMTFLVGLSTNVFSTSLFVKNRLDIAAKRNFESNIMRAIILVVLFISFKANIWYVGFSTLICGLYISLSNLYYKDKFTPQLKIRFIDFKVKALKELVTTGIWNSVNQLYQMLINGLDLLISNIFLDPLSMSLMSFSKIVPVQILSFTGLVSNTFNPHMTVTYAKGDVNKFINEVKTAIKICGFICSVPILGFIAFGSSFFSLWLKELTPSEIHTVQVLSVLTLLPQIFSVYFFPLYNVNMISCKLKIPVLVSLIIGIINLAGMLILLKVTSLGLYAIKLVSSILLVFRVLIFTPLYAADNLKTKWYTFYTPLFRGIISTLINLLLFFALNRIFSINNWSRLLMWVAISGIAGYIINYFILLNKIERNYLKSLVLKKVRR